MNNHLIYILRTTVSFPTTISPRGLHADQRGRGEGINIAVVYVGKALANCKLQQGQNNVNMQN